MGRLGVTALLAYLLLVLGAVLIVAGVFLATGSVGWTLFTAGVLVVLGAGLLIDVPPATPPGVARVGR